MRVKNLDLIGAILIAAINVGWTQLPNRPSVLGIILAIKDGVTHIPQFDVRLLRILRITDRTVNSTHEIPVLLF